MCKYLAVCVCVRVSDMYYSVVAVVVGVGRHAELRPMVQLQVGQLHRDVAVRILQRNRWGSWHLDTQLGLNLQTKMYKRTRVNVSSEWLQAVQVLMVLSVVFSSVSFLVFLGQLFTMSKGGLFYFTGLCQVFAGNGEVPLCAAGIREMRSFAANRTC